VIVCKKLFAQGFKPESFIDVALRDTMYPKKDYHTMYAGEIVELRVKG
jgi:hypothetical protein